MTDGPRFVLVHGAYHGAWCWDLLRLELERCGAAAIAVDLPIDHPDAGAEAYAAAVTASVPPGYGPVVVVGHSMAGLTIPLLPRTLDVERLVYLCALAPQPGVSFDDQNADAGTGFVPSETPYENPDGSASWPARGAVDLFYHDCPPALAAWAARSLRPQHWTITREVTPLRAFHDLPVTYIVAGEDRVLAPDWCRRLARERLGVEPIEIDGGHSPFLSRPAELARLLLAR